MTSSTTHETKVEADPNLPTIRITRDFDAPPERVFRAWMDRDIVVRWLGPDGYTMAIDTWDARTGGSYRYTHHDGSGETYSFFGSFHEVRPNERFVQTFTFEGWPDAVALETLTFEDLGDGRTRCVTVSVYDNIEDRDGIIASGMEGGLSEGYAKLDALLADGDA